MGKTKYKHIIWDWNGTLLDDAWLCVDIMNGVLSRRGMPVITLQKYQELFNFPVIDYYVRLGFDFEKEPFEIVGTEFIDYYEERRHEVLLQKDVQTVLMAVRDAGLTQSLLSAYKQSTLDELVAYHQLSDYFLKIMGLDNHYAHSKVEIGKEWINEMQYGNHEVLFVGDTVHDHEVAAAIGADCVLVPGGHQQREKLEACGVPVLSSLREVTEFVGNTI
ncbi:MAG: HAD family hydrolase [Fidelibacterota bacterium]